MSKLISPLSSRILRTSRFRRFSRKSSDNLKRLISATPTNTGSINQNIESYTYDKTGNRKTDTTNVIGTNYTTNTLDQYTSQSGGVNKSYTYDANGNLKSDGSKTYIYDYNNRLVQVTQSGTTISQYQYDILGRRIQKSTSTETIIYIYAGDNIVQELKTTGGLTLKKEYINGIGTDNLLAYDAQESTNQAEISFCQTRVLPYQSEFLTYGHTSIISRCTDIQTSGTGIVTSRYYYHVNHLGSIIALSNGSGDIVQNYAYDTFGKAYVISGSGTLTSVDSVGNMYGNTRLYTGREYDKEVSLYFNRARYYNPETGRFISRDSIGQKDQVNLYTYVKNSPLVYIDRTGLNSKPVANTQNVWDWYMRKSDEFGGYLYDNISPYEQDIIATIDRTRRYSGYVGLAAVSVLFIPPATPFAAGIIGATGVMSFGAGVTESIATQDKKYLLIEGAGLVSSKLGGSLLKEVGVISEIKFNNDAMRYMGQYADGAYGFVKNEVGYIGVAISQAIEQVIGWTAQQFVE